MRASVLLFLLMISANRSQAQQLYPPAKDSMGMLKCSVIVPQNFYARHIGFFCKQELQLQKRTNLNLFVRLGSKEYVDYLEQKPNARRF